MHWLRQRWFNRFFTYLCKPMKVQLFFICIVYFHLYAKSIILPRITQCAFWRVKLKVLELFISVKF